MKRSKKSKKEIKNNASELRMDIVSDDWVIIAPTRGRRPESFFRKDKKEKKDNEKECIFCQKKIIKKAIARKNKPDGSWFVISMKNDFPAFSETEKTTLVPKKKGPYQVMSGFGYQEVIITADHNRQLAQFSQKEVEIVVELYLERYKELIKKKHIKYVSLFHNHGREAGASVAHPHSQIIAIPIIDPDLKDSLNGAEKYYQANKKCVYCTMIDWDRKEKKRIIYENKDFVVLCPFAPQVSFEVRVYPKKHQPYFEKMTQEEKKTFADALRVALYKIYKGLNNPPYNFYLHTAPKDSGNYEHYHWHFNILPRTLIWAGFELGVGIEISTIKPEEAAAFLRKVR